MLIKVPCEVRVLALLEQAPFEFHLTGSRFFGYDTPESDWDFFVDSAVLGGLFGLENWLRHIGFYKDSDIIDYSKTSIVQVWKHTLAPIQIQIVEDAQLKADVQNVMNSIPRLTYQMGELSKECRKVLWDVALATFSAGEEKCARSVVDFRVRA